MNYFSKIFQQTSWQILGKVVTSFSTFIILGMVARNYGKEGTGLFTLALTYLAIFYMLSDFGFNAHVIKVFKEQNSDIKSEWRHVLGTRLLWSAALVILAVGLLPFWPFTNPNFAQAVLFGSLAIVGSAVFVTCNLIFQTKLRYDLSVLASSIGVLASLIISAAIVSLGWPVTTLLIAHFAGWLIIAIAALFFIKRFIGNINPLFDKKYAMSLLKKTWPIAATLSLNVLYFRADAFLIAYFKSVADVGIYNVAYSVFQSALVLPTFIMNAYYPLMLRSLSGIKLMILGLLGISIAGSMLTIFFSPLIINLLTGGGFEGSITTLQILSLGFPAYFLSSLMMWLFISKDKYKVMLLLYTSGTIFNLVLNFVYIPKYSFLAAAWTTVISEYLILLLQAAILTRERFSK
ncbi:flippase [Candidatus Daviesbacteria bacterium]|nr:flippase [Candidatus Daviesbacteria bacterium]